MNLVEFVPPKPHPLWKLCLQMGITDVIVKVNPDLTGLADPWRYETLKQIVENLQSAGLTVVGLEGDPFDMTPIKEYGASGERTFLSVPPDELILTKDQVWANYEYFIKAVMPTAERLGIRMGLHPDDPCLPSLGGYARIFETVEDYDRAYKIYPSPSNAVTFCQANFKLMLQPGERTFLSVPPAARTPPGERTFLSVQRDEAIAHYRELLESMAKLGIKLLCYNFMVGKGWSRSGVREGRGGAKATYFSFAEPGSAHTPPGERTFLSVPPTRLLNEFPDAIAHASRHFSHTLQSGDYHRRNLPHHGQNGVLIFVTFRLADSLPQDKIAELDAYRAEWLEQHPEPWDAATEEEYNREVATKVDKWLDAGHGSCMLADARCREIVEEALEFDNCTEDEDDCTDRNVRAPREGASIRRTDIPVRSDASMCVTRRTDIPVRSDKARYRLHGYVVMPNHVHVVFELFDAKMLPQVLKSWKGVSARRINELLGTNGKVWQEEYFDRLIRDAEHYKRTMKYLKRNEETVARAGELGTDRNVRAPVRSDASTCDTRRTDIPVRSDSEFDSTSALITAARHFGKRIAFIHVRDVEGDKYDFTELFHDQGDTDQFALMRTYRELGLDVPLRGDHVPEMEGDRLIAPDSVPGYFVLGRLFANGYLKALLKGTEPR